MAETEAKIADRINRLRISLVKEKEIEVKLGELIKSLKKNGTKIEALINNRMIK